MQKYLIPGVAGVAIIIAIIFLFPSSDFEPLAISQQTQNVDSNGIMTTNGLKHIVPLDKIRSGGPPKMISFGCIRSSSLSTGKSTLGSV